MAYFRKLSKLPEMLDLFRREDRWLIAVNADPDAMASALALRRIMAGRVEKVDIARVNEITRPDNLAMIRYTRLRMDKLSPLLSAQYDKFALLDSQPGHHPSFSSLKFSLVIDHHPVSDPPYEAPYIEIKPDYGATSTMLTEYLYNLGLRPGALLATALQFGIKSDTANFQRHFCEVDLRAYHFLARFANPGLLSRIVRSEFHRSWLDYFAKACTSMHKARSGEYVYLGSVENPDLLVGIADFFMRVYEIRWVAVAGLYEDTVVVIFRGDGVSLDLGRMATTHFGELGSAGGHKAMARAEFPIQATQGANLEIFIYDRLLRTCKAKAKKEEAKPEVDL